MNLQAGEVIGKYEIGEVLGKGGMATVYRAVHQPLGRDVALKVLHPHLTIEQIVRDRFLLEARSIASLKHPNIVQIYDYEASDEISFISMEFLDGGALDQQLKLREYAEEKFEPLPVPQALTIGMDIADALHYAHQHGIIHRDVKPANILIGSDNRYVLTDFGIATLLHQNRMTADGATSGTPTYIPPEMITGDRGDERSDIYSLGIVLFQLLTGELPFNSENLYGVLMKHINEPVPSLSELNPEVDDTVSEIVFKALEKNAEDRFSSGKEFSNAIAQLLEHPDINDKYPAKYSSNPLVVKPFEESSATTWIAITQQRMWSWGRWIFQINEWSWPLKTAALTSILLLFIIPFFVFNRFSSAQENDPEQLSGVVDQFTPYIDSFENNDAGWPEAGAPEWQLVYDGIYEMRIETPDHVISAVPQFNDQTFKQFVYQANVQQVDGPPETGYGIVFYYQNPLNYYVFGINGYNQWSIWELKDGSWNALKFGSNGQPWIFSEIVKATNEWNQLRVETRENEIDLFVNGQFLERIQVDQNVERDGKVGLYLATSREQNAPISVIQFDELFVTP
ncbi:MAG: serine/threonine-protein kinase [Chloroflexota bacterium]